MKKLLILCSLLVTLALYSSAQNVLVSGTVQDPTGQVFAGGSYMITFVKSQYSTAPAQNYCIGGSLSQCVNLGPYSGPLDSGGSFSRTLINGDNNLLLPTGSKWQFTVCANIGAGGSNSNPICTTSIFAVHGATYNASTQLNAGVQALLINAYPIATAYKDTEVNTTKDGVLYFRTIDGVLRCLFQGTWSTCSGGGGSGTVTSFSAGNLSPLFTTSVSNPTTTPALSFTLDNFSADSIFGNFTGGSAPPSTQAIPSCANDGSHALVYVSHVLTCAMISGGGGGLTLCGSTNDMEYNGGSNLSCNTGIFYYVQSSATLFNTIYNASQEVDVGSCNGIVPCVSGEEDFGHTPDNLNIDFVYKLGVEGLTANYGRSVPTAAPTAVEQYESISSLTPVNGKLPTHFVRRLRSCQTGLGDGTNIIPASTYLQSMCYNDSGVTYTLTGIRCYTDNNGTSTLDVTNGSGTDLLTGPITCSNSWASGTQSATVTISSSDYFKFIFISDGASKQTTWEIAISY